MRQALLIVSAAAVLGLHSPLAVAGPEGPHAGPLVVHRNACLTAKLNPRLGPPCEAPAIPALTDPPLRSAAYLQRAHFFIDLHEFKQARGEIDAGLEADPENFELRLLSARLAMSAADLRTLDLKRAEGDIAIAMRLKPSDLNARATHAEMLRGKSAREEALRAFNAILTLDPKHDYSRLARAKLLQEFGAHRDALDDLDVLIARDPEQASHFRLRAVSHLALNDPRAAVVDFTSTLRFDSHDMIALTGRLTAHELLGDDERALADYSTILGPVGSQPNYALGGDLLGKYRRQRAFLLVRLKRFEDAAADMASALTAEKSSVLRAQVFLRQNGFPELPLDGRDSTVLRGALQACFGLQSCFQDIKRAI